MIKTKYIVLTILSLFFLVGFVSNNEPKAILSEDVEMHTADGKEIPVYERPIVNSVDEKELISDSNRKPILSKDVEMHTADGKEIPVYEQPVEE